MRSSEDTKRVASNSVAPIASGTVTIYRKHRSGVHIAADVLVGAAYALTGEDEPTRDIIGRRFVEFVGVLPVPPRVSHWVEAKSATGVSGRTTHVCPCRSTVEAVEGSTIRAKCYDGLSAYPSDIMPCCLRTSRKNRPSGYRPRSGVCGRIRNPAGSVQCNQALVVEIVYDVMQVCECASRSITGP